MSGDILVMGYGAVGKATVKALAGRAVRVAQRSRPKDLPASIPFVACDVLDPLAVRQAVNSASEIVIAIGFAYDSKVWRETWPKAMANILHAAELERARMIFVDNLYMYGPQTAPLREDMALQDFGAKPAVRSAITRQWMDAHHSGRVKCVALRAPDFYGPGVTLSHLGDLAFGNLAKGKSAMVVIDPDQLHAFAYVPDIARGVVSLLNASDKAFGQAWHIPCAPIMTPRDILTLAMNTRGKKLKLTAIPMSILPLMGLFTPFMKEMVEMRFQWDRTYEVDSSKFAQHFWSDATSFEVGAKATFESFRGDSR